LQGCNYIYYTIFSKSFYAYYDYLNDIKIKFDLPGCETGDRLLALDPILGGVGGYLLNDCGGGTAIGLCREPAVACLRIGGRYTGPMGRTVRFSDSYSAPPVNSEAIRSRNGSDFPLLCSTSRCSADSSESPREQDIKQNILRNQTEDLNKNN